MEEVVSEEATESITITWVRHGELNSQVLEYAIDDFPYNPFVKDKAADQIAYEKKVNAYRRKAIIDETEHYTEFLDTDKGFDNFKQICANIQPVEQDNRIKFTKILIPLNELLPEEHNKTIEENVDEIMNNKVNDALVKANNPHPKFTDFLGGHFLTPSSWYFSPTLNSLGVKNAKRFGENFLKPKMEKYDRFITSPTVRSIMTALYALSVAGMNDAELIIIPNINERNITLGGLEERINVGIPVDIIDTIILIIQDFIKKDYPDDQIKINTQIYKDAYHSDAGSPGSDEELAFYAGDFKKGKKYIDALNAKNILAFVHGAFINERINENTKINTPSSGKELAISIKDNKKQYLPGFTYPLNCTAYEMTYKKGDNTEGLTIKYEYNDKQASVRTKQFVLEDDSPTNKYDESCRLDKNQ